MSRRGTVHVPLGNRQCLNGVRHTRSPPHTAIVAGSKVLGGRRFLVWLYIHHRVWSDKANTVLIGNKTFSTWGVSRKVKYTALRRLAEAGLIAVQWRVRRSPTVTLLLK